MGGDNPAKAAIENSMPKKKLNTNEVVAYHEAGHAVAARLARLRFKTVTVIPDDDSLGKCSALLWKNFHPDYQTGMRVTSQVKALTFVILAGSVAEARFTGGKKSRGVDYQDHMKVAYRLVSYLPGSSKVQEAYVLFMLEQTKDFLEINWSAVEVVASALLERQTLRSSEVQKLIKDQLVGQGTELI